MRPFSLLAFFLLAAHGLEVHESEVVKEINNLERSVHDIIEIMSKHKRTPMKLPNPYDESVIQCDVDGNGEDDILIEGYNGRGVTGNRGFYFFCSINGKMQFVQEFDNIVKLVRYKKTGNAYLIDSGRAGDIRLFMYKISQGVVQWKGVKDIHLEHDEGIDSVSKDVILYKELHTLTFEEEDLLKVFKSE